MAGTGQNNDIQMRIASFAAMLCSRLCHDLVSPVGALANGIEILAEEDDPEMREQVLALLEDSARQTNNRLQFFRLAFGAAGGFGEKVDLREAQKATESLLSQSKISLDWQPCAQPVRKEAVKLILNLVLVASEAMIRGGDLVAAMAAEGNRLSISIAGEGERILFNEATSAVLRGQVEESGIDPRLAPAYLAYLMAQFLGASIEVEVTGRTDLRISCQVENAF